MPATMSYTDVLTILDCGVCHITFAIPNNLYSKLTRTGDWFWCPNGDKIHYFETENAKLAKAKSDLEDRLTRERAYLDQVKAERDAVQRSLSATKGVVTRQKRKAAHALCPVDGCGRHLVQMQRHLSAKHPDWVAAHSPQEKS